MKLIIPFVSVFISLLLNSAFAENMPESMDLWPTYAPGSETVEIELNIDERATEQNNHNRAVSQITVPKLQTFIPQHPNGTSVIICPGGGYRYLAYDKEGVDIAKKLNESGITAFVLTYRLPAEGHKSGTWVPLQDAQRALRLVRFHSENWGLDQDKIGIMGFSAGGHLASTLGTHYNAQCYPVIDEIDSICARPDFMILIYPVVSMDEHVTHMGSRTHLVGETPTYSTLKTFSNALQVDENTPPTFLALASDDGAVNPENSIQFAQGLLKAKVPVEMHLFESGGHGYGLRYTPGSTRYWPELLIAWMQNRGYLNED